MINPLVSIIFPVYNAELYLEESIQSILNQTIKDFELIIIDDGSTDSSLKKIKYYAKNDNRVIVHSRENKGLIYTLNEAISMCKGDFIARMDADDICSIERLEKQIDFLDRNPNVDIVGCDFDLINAAGKKIGTNVVPKTEDDIFLTLFYTVPFAHPSVMTRKEFFLDNKYGENEDFTVVEDYDLWVKSYRKYRYGNVDQLLLSYRVFGESFSFSKRYLMYKATNKLGSSFFLKNKERFFECIKTSDNSIYKFRACAMVFSQCPDQRLPILKLATGDVKLCLGLASSLIRGWLRGFYSYLAEIKYNFSSSKKCG